MVKYPGAIRNVLKSLGSLPECQMALFQGVAFFVVSIDSIQPWREAYAPPMRFPRPRTISTTYLFIIPIPHLLVLKALLRIHFAMHQLF